MEPFYPTGPTYTFTAATTAPTAVQTTTNDGTRAPQTLLTNAGDEDVFVSWSPNSSAEAIVKAVVPTATPQFGYYLLAGTQVVVSVPSGYYFTGDAVANTSIIYVCAGYGA